MSWRSSFASFMLICAQGLWGGGCVDPAAVLSPLMPKTPHVNGAWTGVITAVTVVDHEGREFKAAALRIEAGPLTLRGMDRSYTMPQGSTPFLMQIDGSIMHPPELGVPLGARVRVKGMLHSAGAGVQITDDRGFQEFRHVWRAPGEPPGGVLQILMRGEPKVDGEQRGQSGSVSTRRCSAHVR